MKSHSFSPGLIKKRKRDKGVSASALLGVPFLPCRGATASSSCEAVWAAGSNRARTRRFCTCISSPPRIQVLSFSRSLHTTHSKSQIRYNETKTNICVSHAQCARYLTRIQTSKSFRGQTARTCHFTARSRLCGHPQPFTVRIPSLAAMREGVSNTGFIKCLIFFANKQAVVDVQVWQHALHAETARARHQGEKLAQGRSAMCYRQADLHVRVLSLMHSLLFLDIHIWTFYTGAGIYMMCQSSCRSCSVLLKSLYVM